MTATEMVTVDQDRLDGLAADLSPALADELCALAVAADRYAAASRAPNMTRAYESDWRQYATWCERYSIAPLGAPAAVIGLYITSLAERGLGVSTIRRRCAAITRVHRQAGLLAATGDPRVLRVIEGIARTRGTASHKKVALLRDPLVEMIEQIDISTNAGLRDRAMLLVGFAVGLRRSEIVALTVEDLSPDPDGLRIRIARSKTDQEDRGIEMLVPRATPPRPCAVRAMHAWLDASQITTGPIFWRLSRAGTLTTPLRAESVALIIKRRARAVGLDPDNFAGHSLRAGFATQAARDGHRAEQIAQTTRHKDRRTLAGYMRAGTDADHVTRVL